MQPNTELAGERSEARERHVLAFRLRLRENALRLELHERGVLGRLHIGCAAAAGAPDQRFGGIEIGRDRAACPELHQGRAEASRGW